MNFCGGDESAPPLDNRPLWKYVTKMTRTKEGGGNIPFTCNLSKATYKGSYSRVKSHLLKIGGSRIKASSQSCSHFVSVDALNSMRQEGYEYDPKKRKVDGDNPIEKAFNYIGREQLDAEIAKMFYSAGLPFNLARNLHYVKTFSYATNNRIAGYVPPGYNALRTTLLAKERRRNTDANEITYDECHWITEIATSTVMIKNFISNHSMRLAMFNEFSKLKLFVVAETRFASVWQTQHPNFTPPQSDLEISKMRKLCLKRLVPDEDAQRKVNIELANFLGCLEDFGDGDCLRDRFIMSPTQWWTLHGPAAPNLQNIVVKLLAHVSSSSCSERYWTIFVFYQERPPQYMQGDTKMWDVRGDAFESSDDVGILEIANILLDELVLENDLFVDEVGEAPYKDSNAFPNVED
ncbi:hypothetical protein BUALT_Bualt11G0015500 [Buddleja alternifolia]|uniref:HAT C-terminal dimerisation domain-containing protein n=1 Tax=Buddleja alternifolia TaxID=168488 RepID=A0AAV6WZT5_9LAMI|nr:hypothetical protein BUALT_Bualt11G0015500 [Buddleja alternifolia]